MHGCKGARIGAEPRKRAKRKATTKSWSKSRDVISLTSTNDLSECHFNPRFSDTCAGVGCLPKATNVSVFERALASDVCMIGGSKCEEDSKRKGVIQQEEKCGNFVHDCAQQVYSAQPLPDWCERTERPAEAPETGRPFRCSSERGCGLTARERESRRGIEGIEARGGR